MDRDSALIFENYLNSRKNIISEADEKQEKEHWLWSVAKVLDPTGISSYPDVISSAAKFSKDPNYFYLAQLILNIFLALPNFGLLAFGVGGIGWAGLKAAAKTAAKAGPDAIGPVAKKVMEAISKNSTVKRGFEKTLDSLVSNGTLKAKNKRMIMDAIEKGEIKDALMAKSMEKGFDDIAKSGTKAATEIGKSITKEMPWWKHLGIGKNAPTGKLAKFQMALRGVRSPMDKDITSDPMTDSVINYFKNMSAVPKDWQPSEKDPEPIKFSDIKIK